MKKVVKKPRYPQPGNEYWHLDGDYKRFIFLKVEILLRHSDNSITAKVLEVISPSRTKVGDRITIGYGTARTGYYTFFKDAVDRGVLKHSDKYRAQKVIKGIFS